VRWRSSGLCCRVSEAESSAGGARFAKVVALPSRSGLTQAGRAVEEGHLLTVHERCFRGGCRAFLVADDGGEQMLNGGADGADSEPEAAVQSWVIRAFRPGSGMRGVSAPHRADSASPTGSQAWLLASQGALFDVVRCAAHALASMRGVFSV